MVNGEFEGSTPHVARSRAKGCVAWAIAIALVSIAVGYFVVKPLVERALDVAGDAANTIIEGAAQAVAAAARIMHEQAYDRVASSPQVRALVGEPVVCAPLEKVQFLSPQDAQTVEFKFEVRGPKATADAHAIATTIDRRIELKNVSIVVPGGETIELPAP